MIEKLLAIFEKETGKKVVSVNVNTMLRKDLDINSYEFVQVVCAIEDEFDIEIPDKELATMITVGDVVDYIKSHK